MFDTTITLYNYRASTKTWHTRVFTGVDLHASDSDNKTQYGMTNADTVALIIHDSKADYLEPKAYAAVTTVDGKYTLTPGTDFFVVGNEAAQTPISDASYPEGLYHHMNAERDDVYLINSAEYFTLIPHWEIGGR